jgi:hypothetical protein
MVTFSNTMSSSGHFDQIRGPATPANLLNTRQVQVQIAGPQSELLQGQQPLQLPQQQGGTGAGGIEV